MSYISGKREGLSFRDLCILSYANGFTQHHYRTRDTIADVCAQGYFSDAACILLPGDLLIVSAADGVGQFGIASGPRLTAVVTVPAVKSREVEHA